MTAARAGLLSRLAQAGKRLVGVSDRKIQEAADLHEAFLLLSLYAGGKAAAEEAMAKVKMATWKKELEVAELLRKQAQPMFEAIEEVFTGDDIPYDAQEKMAARVGYSLQKHPSSIDGAGNGLFLQSGEVRPGQLVALVPGLIWLPLFGRDMPNYPDISKGNDQLHVFYDGVILDSLWWDVVPPEKAVEKLREAVQKGGGGESESIKPKLDRRLRQALEEGEPKPAEAGSQATKWRAPLGPVSDSASPGVRVGPDRRNPLALGHLANHPPRDKSPNVIKVPASWLRNDKHLAWCPNRWYLEGSMFTNPQDTYRGFCLVAKQSIKAGDEIFSAYRFNPNLKHLHPEWYWDVDPDASARRFAD